MGIFSFLFKDTIGVSLNVAWNSTERFTSFASTSVLVLDKFEVVGVEPEYVVVAAFVLIIGTVWTIESNVKVSEEEVEGFYGCK